MEALMPEFGQCDECKRNRLLRYKVSSDTIDMAVCWECGREAMRIAALDWGEQANGQITVRELEP
jgi:hypothetical protein